LIPEAVVEPLRQLITTGLWAFLVAATCLIVLDACRR
jgi:hypothetical protein